jgi:hypothetical protein
MTQRVLAKIALVGLFGVIYAYAQTGTTLVADIPFAFHLADKLLPAGQYVISPESGNGTILVRGTNIDAPFLVLTDACQKVTAPREGKLDFHRYGTSYFLARIWTPGYYQGRELHRSRVERELAASRIVQVASIGAAVH